MSTSNWQRGVEQSDFHFEWDRNEMAGYDYKWLATFQGDWTQELEQIKQDACLLYTSPSPRD